MMYVSFKIGRWGQIGWECRRNRIGHELIVTEDGWHKGFIILFFPLLNSLKFFILQGLQMRIALFSSVGGTTLSP